MDAIVGGADEAGRGPVLGPMVVCAACFREGDVPGLQEQGVTDSKRLSPKRREELCDVIARVACGFELVVLSAVEINEGMAAGTNLNDIEVAAFARAINAMIRRGTIPHTMWVDSADVKPNRFGERIRRLLCARVAVNASHNADATYTAVGAASILAKVTRDRLVRDLAAQHGDFGSGYPSDPKTRAFLKAYYHDHGGFPPFARAEWKTLDALRKEMGAPPAGQTRLF
ncbi:MAG: ribonuclease HII [Candidatus Lokiarchaeota archaeon]|nr:ribonuclease HII [Candidatus Lokiarchaeota archaeon]